ncbi:MAG: Crp/Fnr family transcriptional regulator [Deltaproteobacteria bacterium]|nr:MAG: Crp/Fnr family transcriptional regulator [Deltaproteobacteria bacterium]
MPMSDTDHRRKELLQNVGLFAGLDEAEIDSIVPLLRYNKYVKDQVIVEMGDPGRALFIVETGTLKVVLNDNKEREVILSLLREGDFFGEIALLDEKPRSATVIALVPTRLYSLERDLFLEYVESNPKALLQILKVQFERLRAADQMRHDLALLGVYGRVARLVLQLAQDEGEYTEEGTLITKPPSQQHIAGMVGASRETVSRVINELVRMGTIKKQGRKLLITSELNLYDQIDSNL